MKRKASLIILDLDGTLYDLHDVEEMSFEIQTFFLAQKKYLSHQEAKELLNKNHIYVERKPDSKSATELFSVLGISMEEWSDFRNQRFEISAIDKTKSIKEADILQLKRNNTVVLLSSNSTNLIERELLLLGFDNEDFSEIICSDSGHILSPFCKKEAMKYISSKYDIHFGEIISIGDRYQTDIVPILELGGKGVLVDGPQGLRNYIFDYSRNVFKYDSYTLYGF